MKQLWVFIIVLISSCQNAPIVKINSDGLTEFHPAKGNWILSHKLLTEPESTDADTFWLDDISDLYRYFDEGPLFYEFKNVEIIRISFIESFDNHTLFKFVSYDDFVQLIEKELKEQIIYSKADSSFFTVGWYEYNPTYDTIHEYRRASNIYTQVKGLHSRVGEYDPIVKKQIRQIANSKWNKIAELVNSNEFREMSPTDQYYLDDGYNMIIEIHNSSGYHLYIRQNPKDAVTTEIIEQLLELSNNDNFKELHGGQNP